MTTNHHTPYDSSDSLTASDLNAPLGQLDAAIDSGVSPLTTKGDLWTYSSADARLAVGTNGYLLGADSTATPGLAFVPGPSYFAIIRDQKTTTTSGGSSSAATWNVRDLNTESSDTRSIVSVSTNRITPIAGTYLIEASAPAFDCGLHKLKLYNVTGTADIIFGQVAEALAASDVTSRAQLIGTFTANGTDAYEIQHYTQSAKATTGLGKPVSDGSIEVYTTVKLTLLSV